MKLNLVLAISVLLIIGVALARMNDRDVEPSVHDEKSGLPQRIIPTTSDQIDFLSALIDPERIVAIPEQALTWSRVADDVAWKEKPTYSRFLAEPILARKPDLVLVSPFAEPDSVARLRESGTPMLELPVRKDIDDVVAAVRELARVLGAEERGLSLIAEIEARRAALVKAQAGVAPRRVLSYTNFGSGGWTAGSGTTIDTAIKLAGLENVMAGRQGHFECSFEELLALDPDYIIVSAAFGESGDTIETLLRTQPDLAGVRAIHDDRIIRIHPRLASAGSQELLATAEALVVELARVEARR